MTIPFGNKLKQIRESSGMSIEDAALKANITVSQLEMIESSAATPSLAVAIRLSRALNVRLGTIMDGCESNPISITRAADHQDEGVSFSNGTATDPVNLNFFPLARNKAGRSMEPFFIDVEPSDDVNSNLSSHEGEEFIYVINGQIKIVLGDKIVELGSGDTIYYDSLVPHKIYAEGGRARVLAVIYAPW